MAIESRPDLAGRTAILQQSMPHPSIQDIVEANILAQEAHRDPELVSHSTQYLWTSCALGQSQMLCGKCLQPQAISGLRRRRSGSGTMYRRGGSSFTQVGPEETDQTFTTWDPSDGPTSMAMGSAATSGTKRTPFAAFSVNDRTHQTSSCRPGLAVVKQAGYQISLIH